MAEDVGWEEDNEDDDVDHREKTGTDETEGVVSMSRSTGAIDGVSCRCCCCRCSECCGAREEVVNEETDEVESEEPKLIFLDPD